MGNVETGITDPQVKQRLTRNYLSSKAECRKCWARFYCGADVMLMPISVTGAWKYQPVLPVLCIVKEWNVRFIWKLKKSGRKPVMSRGETCSDVTNLMKLFTN